MNTQPIPFILAFAFLISCNDDLPLIEEQIVEPVLADSIPELDCPLFQTVQVMPRFPNADCEALIATDAEKKRCADEAMLIYIYDKLNYPAEAREQGVEGTVPVSFVVDVDGTLKYIEVVDDIGAGCGDAAKEIVENMNNEGLLWIPGNGADGEKVKVRMTLVFKFKLE